MAQYEVEAPKNRNVAVRAGGRHYVLLKGTKQTYEASGDVIGILEAHGCKARHVGDEPTAAAVFHAQKVAAARAAGPEDLNDYAPVEAKVGAPEKPLATDEEEGDPTVGEVTVEVGLADLSVSDLRALAKEASITIPSGTNKAGIISLLEASESTEGEEE